MIEPIADFFLKDEAATLAFAATLAGFCRAGDCIALAGDLGTGKTCFARGFIQTLLPKAEVTSPTFTLVQHYDIADPRFPALRQIWHADLYRLEREEEFLELGFEDARSDGIALIEWPERAECYLPADRLEIALREEGSARRLALSGADPEWRLRLAELSLSS